MVFFSQTAMHQTAASLFILNLQVEKSSLKAYEASCDTWTSLKSFLPEFRAEILEEHWTITIMAQQ